MKFIAMLGLLCLAGPVLGAAAFEEGYRHIATYQTVRSAAIAARDELTGVARDPAATPIERTLARQRLNLAESLLARAAITARVDHLGLYVDLVQARDRIAVSDAVVAQADLAARVAEIKQKAGAISLQESDAITNALASAKMDAVNARQAAALAKKTLRAISDEPKAAMPLPPAFDLTKLQIVDPPPVASALAGLVEANYHVADAERAHALAQGPDTSMTDLSARERELQSAREIAKTLVVQLSTELEKAKQDYQEAVAAMTVADRSLASARKSLATAQIQYESGLASRMAVLELQIVLARAVLSRDTALANLWRAYYRVCLSAGVLPD